jgi:hypothetical protein
MNNSQMYQTVNYQSFINKMIHDIMNKIANLMFAVEMEEFTECDKYMQELIRIVNLYRCLNNGSVDWSLLKSYMKNDSSQPDDFSIFLICSIINLSNSRYTMYINESNDLINIFEEKSRIYNPLLSDDQLTNMLTEVLHQLNKQSEFYNNSIKIIHNNL